MDGKRLALIVANDEYQDAGLEQLQSPTEDAVALGGVLGDPQIGNFDVQVIRNESAHVIEARIEDFFSERRPEDLLLLHFSCHGLKSESGELFFAASNTRPNRLASTGIPADFVQRCMRGSRSRSIVLLLDCCYGGAFSQGAHVRATEDVNVLDSFDGGKLGGGRGWAVITASNAMEYAFEGAQLADEADRRPSVFTSAVVEGLVTGDADRDEDGRISLNELYDYVFDLVREQNPHQSPSRTFELQGDLYVARSRRRRIHPNPIPADLRAASTDANVFTRLGAVTELRFRLANQDLPVALGAHRALTEMVQTDIRMITEAAERALQETAINPDQQEVDFGLVPQHASRPHRVVHLLGPPIACDCAPESTVDWLRITESDEGVDISLDTSRTGSLHGKVILRGPTGEAVIPVIATVTAQVTATPDPAPADVAPPSGTPRTASAPQPEAPREPSSPPRWGILPEVEPDPARAQAQSGRGSRAPHPVRPSVPPGPKWALVLAIASLLLSTIFGLGGITAIFALMLARRYDAALRDPSGEYHGRSLNRATRIISWLAIALAVFFLVVEVSQGAQK